MIQAVIVFLNSRLDVLGLYKDLRGLCEKIQDVSGETTKIFPAEWCNEDYQHIDVNNNPEEGIAYHRQTGPMTEVEDSEEGVTACDVQVTRTYPMRIVSYIPKNVLSKENNNQYIDDKLATNVINTLKTINDQVLSAALKASSVSVDIISTQKDRYTVYAEEYTLPSGHVPGFEYAYFAIDYNIVIIATQGCFENFDCDGFVVPEFCPTTADEKILNVEFGANGDDDRLIDIEASQAGTYNLDAATLTNVDSAVYKKNTVAVTGEQLFIVGDTLEVLPTRTIPGVLSKVVLNT